MTLLNDVVDIMIICEEYFEELGKGHAVLPVFCWGDV